MQLHSAMPFFKAFVPSWLVTYLLASFFHTQRVLHALNDIDVAITLQARLRTSVDDFIGLLPKYGSAIALAMIIAMLVAVIITRRHTRSAAVTTIAGAVAMLVMLLVMKPIMDVTLIAGAREPMGIALQCLAGAVGGLLFAGLYRYFQSQKIKR